MDQAQSLLYQLFMRLWGVKGSLRYRIAAAMCAGLLIPAIIGGFAVTSLKQVQMRKDLESYLNDKVVLLANSLVNPVWNYDTDSVRTIVDAVFFDPQVVRVTVTTLADTTTPFFKREQPGVQRENVLGVRQLLVRDGELIGMLELEIDDNVMQHAFQETRRIYSVLFFVQFVIALGLVILAIRRWVLKPLSALSDFSDQLASGNLEGSLSWRRSDEIGQLALQMDRMRQKLRTAFADQRAILDNVQAGVLFVQDNVIQFANQRAEHIFGYGPGQLCGQSARALHLSDHEYQIFAERTAIKLNSGTASFFEEEICLKRFDGLSFWAWVRGSVLYAGEPIAGQIWVVSDITLRKEAENQINNLAFYDPLTGLPNRRLLLDRLQQQIVAHARTSGNGALFFIDLDNFKTLNDMYGHGIGDLLLQQVAIRLTKCVRESDTVARLGGDEFVVMLDNLSKNFHEAGDQARIVGEKIIEAITQPYLLDSYECNSSPSIGITIFSGESANERMVEELLKQADIALYQAKAAGRNTLRFFDQEMQAKVMERALMEMDLREALGNQQFHLYYQAQVGRDGLLGAEVLLRWIHPERGMVSPAQFIPLAEDTCLILPVGTWVLETACAQLAVWAKRPETAHLVIAVNVSALQLRHRDFVQQVWNALEKTGADPHRLKLELTESQLANDVESIIAKMTVLKRLGVGFSIDDFGTGYSSLAYLKRLPLDQLKIDQSFVRDILIDPNDAAIAGMVITLAKSLGLSVIAEGVETEAQRDFLAELGCHNAQGYLFSRPLPLPEFEAFCARQLQASEQ